MSVDPIESLQGPPDHHEVRPAMWEHARTVYRAMEEEATPMDDEKLGPCLVYEGFLTQLVRQVGLSTPYYSKVTRLLEGSRAAVQVRRGGGTAPSQWALFGEPTDEALQNFEAKDTGSNTLKRGGGKTSTQQQLNDMNRRLMAVEDTVSSLVDAFEESGATDAS